MHRTDSSDGKKHAPTFTPCQDSGQPPIARPPVLPRTTCTPAMYNNNAFVQGTSNPPTVTAN